MAVFDPGSLQVGGFWYVAFVFSAVEMCFDNVITFLQRAVWEALAIFHTVYQTPSEVRTLINILIIAHPPRPPVTHYG